jgi:hypothetical protein
MIDILLIQPPIRDFYLTAKRTIPYGLTCIAAALIKEGFAVEILDGLATFRSRIIDMPREMAHLREYYFETDRSPFALFNHYKGKWPANPVLFWWGFLHFLHRMPMRRLKWQNPLKHIFRIAK